MTKLPNKIVITQKDISEDIWEYINEKINNYLAEKYGFCNSGYGVELKVTVEDIDWDTSD